MDERWYKRAVIYSVEVDAFQDADGDGLGDLRGLFRHGFDRHRPFDFDTSHLPVAIRCRLGRRAAMRRSNGTKIRGR